MSKVVKIESSVACEQSFQKVLRNKEHDKVYWQK